MDKKINTTACHPQTDGLVEMNRTPHSMLAKHAHQFRPDWDLHLQQLLIAYCVKPQYSTGEAPFYLVCGRNARLPTESPISQPLTPYHEDLVPVSWLGCRRHGVLLGKTSVKLRGSKSYSKTRSGAHLNSDSIQIHKNRLLIRTVHRSYGGSS